jgi:hypothetical protein
MSLLVIVTISDVEQAAAAAKLNLLLNLVFSSLFPI